MITLKSLTKLTLATVAAGTLGTASTFALTFNDDVTPNVIMGDGIGNGGWTVDRDNGVEIGLRAKLRHNNVGAPENTFTNDGAGTYSFDAKVAPTQSTPTGVWSFEWSINSDYQASASARALSALTYLLCIDIDPSQGTSFVAFDIINAVNPKYAQVLWDHSLGDNSTPQGGTNKTVANPNGGGVESATSAEYLSNISLLNVAQNSQKAHWIIPGYLPDVDATYDFKLAAFDGNTELASSTITVIQGKGGAPVPDAGSTAALLGAGILGLIGFRRFSKRS